MPGGQWAKWRQEPVSKEAHTHFCLVLCTFQQLMAISIIPREKDSHSLSSVSRSDMEGGWKEKGDRARGGSIPDPKDQCHLSYCLQIVTSPKPGLAETLALLEYLQLWSSGMCNLLASPLLTLRVSNVIVQPSASTNSPVLLAQVPVNERGPGLWKGRVGEKNLLEMGVWWEGKEAEGSVLGGGGAFFRIHSLPLFLCRSPASLPSTLALLIRLLSTALRATTCPTRFQKSTPRTQSPPTRAARLLRKTGRRSWMLPRLS